MVTTAPAAGTFAQRWRRAVHEVGDRTFLVFEAGDGSVTELTYATMDELVTSAVRGLSRRGMRAGAAVHLVQPNSVAFVVTWLACATTGAWMVPSDPRASVSELAAQIHRTNPAVAVCTPHRAVDYRRAAAAAGDRGNDVELVEASEDDAAASSLCATGARPTVSAATDHPAPGDRLAVMFTSGTTSAPKGVVLTQANYAFVGDAMAAAAALDRDDRQFVVLPLFHANAQYYSFAAAISVGASVALMATFSASRFVEQARRHAVTHASLFAAPIRMILARTDPGARPLALQHAWFAQNLSAQHYAAISRLLGCRPRQLYGMTETIPAVLSNPVLGSDPNSIGTATLGCHVRVVDADGTSTTAGETGAIQVGGFPGSTLFAGYLDDNATTEAAIVERHESGFVWFDTGDRARLDHTGFHHFAGRRSDVLKVAGENVSIVEIEHVLGEHPLVTEVAVVGAPDEVRDEVPEAFVVLAAAAAQLDATATIDDLESWSSERLAPSKRPRAFHIVDELPRTAVGKVRKFLLAGSSTPNATTTPQGGTA